ncbi:transporter, major facilitator family protein [Mycobacterium parascrofulaceum ATCC BAA-614]|uniref:Transporter, major facilitator family protein n=1 Tax=Mycobacterium parascrofulaceum ATCC BAA-614 TaxID=525368 RepID=D5PIL1_9MYCO|nr:MULTISPECIES: MFS transporter [Mycobacterium]EFG74120.1 transporter, major facilitator family protein [Mycobacterium parascrofulaceum ATCC BAA-614]OCB37810.1 MFS transporter [Mycobacterium malmoense]
MTGQDSAARSAITGKTVQEYIDERPKWSDGTVTPSTPMTSMQLRIWALASAGKFFEGMVVFMTGAALPLISIEFHLAATEQGLVTAASLAGILVGASVLGGMADRYGRKRMFIVEMVIFTIFLAALTFSPNFVALLSFLFGAGLALGCDYPTAHMVIAESTPTSRRGRLVLSAFAFQAVGALIGTAAGFVILYKNPDVTAWRWMYGVGVLPAVAVIVGRFFVTDSPQWLLSAGRTEEAEKVTCKLLERDPQYPRNVTLRRGGTRNPNPESGYRALFAKKNRRATILASVPWFLQDLGLYGIGIFTPTMLAAVIGEKSPAQTLPGTIHNDILGIKGSALMDLLFVAGIVTAILLVDKAGRMRLEITGFIGCAVGLALAALSIRPAGGHNVALLFTGFTLFYFMSDLGPNSMTYLVAGEVFPTRVRGKGAGFAASFAKVAAVMTAFLFPILLKSIGTTALLYVLVGAFALGAAVTYLFRIETGGTNLERIGDTSDAGSASLGNIQP